MVREHVGAGVIAGDIASEEDATPLTCDKTDEEKIQYDEKDAWRAFAIGILRSKADREGGLHSKSKGITEVVDIEDTHAFFCHSKLFNPGIGQQVERSEDGILYPKQTEGE